MPLYTKKPVAVEARQWDGTAESFDTLRKWSYTPGIGPNLKMNSDQVHVWVAADDAWLLIEPGEWIIRGAIQPLPDRPTRYHPCKPDVFEATYEPVGGGQDA